MSHTLLILKIYTTFKDIQMMLKWFFDISNGFRFGRSVWECSVHSCSCPWLNLVRRYNGNKISAQYIYLPRFPFTQRFVSIFVLSAWNTLTQLKSIFISCYGIGRKHARKKGLKDVLKWCSMIFDPPTYHARRFLPYSFWFLNVILDPPTNPKIERH